MTNSSRWLSAVRTDTIPTGADALNVNVPAKDGARNGNWLRKFAVWPLAGRTKLPCPKSVPPWSGKLNEIVTGVPFGLANATPVFTGPFTSAYVLPDVIGLIP